IAVDNGAPKTGGRVAIVGNVIHQSGEAGIAVVDRGSVISANVIESVDGRGIEIRGDPKPPNNNAPDESAVVGNTITDAAMGIGTAVANGGVSGLTIVGNTIAHITKRRPQGFTFAGEGAGMVLGQDDGSMSNSSVSSNTVSDTQLEGILAVE